MLCDQRDTGRLQGDLLPPKPSQREFLNRDHDNKTLHYVSQMHMGTWANYNYVISNEEQNEN